MALTAASSASAGETWSGGGSDGNWSTVANWGGAVPVAGGGLNFGGTTNLNTNNDEFAAGTGFGTITFLAGAGAFTLAGNSIALAGNVVNSSNQLQTIDLGISMAAGRIFTTNEAAGGLVQGGALSGAGRLTKTGNGTLTLTATNAYAGGTTLTNGSITFGAASSASVSQSLAGALVNTVGNEANVTSQGGNSGNASLTFASATYAAGSVTNFVVSGGINGVSNQIKVTGTAAGLMATNVFFNGADFADMDASGYVRAGVYGTEATFVNAGSSLTAADNNQVATSITGQGAVSVLTLKFAGPTAVDLTQNASTTVTVSKGGILRSGGGSTTISGGSLNTASGGAFTVRTDSASDSLTINSNIVASGANTLTKSGAGTLTLGGANTYTGITYVDDGVLTITGTQSSSSSTSVYDATLNLNHAGALTGGALTAANVDAVITENVANALSGAAKLAASAGTIELGYANNFTGTTALTGGTLVLGQAGALGTSAVSLNGGSVSSAPNIQSSSSLTGANAVTNNFSLNGIGIFSGANSIETSGNLTVVGTNRQLNNNISGGVLTLDNVLLSDTGGSHQLAIQGNGTTVIKSLSDTSTGAAIGTQSGSPGLVINLASGSVALDGSNASTYTDTTTLDVGTLLLGNKDALGTGALVFAAGGGLLAADTDLTGANKVMNNVTVNFTLSNVAITGTNSLELGGSFTFANVSAAGIFLNNSGGSMLTLSGNVFLSNSTTGQTVTFKGNGNSTISGVIADSSAIGASASGLTKMGTGTMTLAGANTYSGTTIVNSGALLVNGSIQSPVIVATGGVFGGTGSSNAAISVLVGSTLTGGGAGSVGTFTTTGALTLGNSSIYQVDFSPSTGLFDKVSANGVSLNGGILSLNGLGSGTALTLGSSFVILDNTSSSAVSGTFVGLPQGSTILADGDDFSISYVGGTGNDVVLTETGGLSAVPEPSTYALFAGGAALLAALLRRRKTLRA